MALRPRQAVRKLFEIFKIVATLLVNALVNGKVLAILLRLQDMIAVGANERQRFGDLFAARKNATADFAQE
jgi:hypothetical protein